MSEELQLDIPKKKIMCKDIISVELLDKRDTTIRIKYVPDDGALVYDWLLKLNRLPGTRNDKDMTLYGLMWYRKITRCSIQVVDPSIMEAEESMKRRGVDVKIDRQLGSITRDSAIFGTLHRQSRRPSSTFMGGTPLLLKSK